MTIAAGGFVAGTRAGLIYNTFPLMDGHLVPAGYAQLHPFVRNWFENIPAIQFDHRLLARRPSLSVLVLWAVGLRRPLPGPARVALWALLGAALAASGARHLDLAVGRADPARRGSSGRRRPAADRRDRLPPYFAPGGAR